MSSISNLSDIPTINNGATTLTLSSTGKLTINKTTYATYLTITQGDANGEGGQFTLNAPTGYTDISLDNYQGHARILCAGATGFQVITQDGTLIVRGTQIDNEAWITPTMVNSWTNYGGGTEYNTAGYFKDRMGVVHLKGLLAGGTVGATAFSMPAGYRPMRQELFGTFSNNAEGRVDVDTGGNVIIQGGSNVWITLDGITFRAYQ